MSKYSNFIEEKIIYYFTSTCSTFILFIKCKALNREERRVGFFSIHCPQTTIPTVWSRVTVSGNRCSCTEVSRALLICSICWDGLHVPGVQPVLTHGFMSSWILLGSSKHTIRFHEKKRNVFSGSVSNYLCMAASDRIHLMMSDISGQGKSSWCQWCT